ncbi:MAG: PEP-CTERM sorting domain-containing protein [Sedimentisphaerales bacterium]|nr:PEP-CTERM sorting domain-containing protein [Sedimentisphaerales bacterium]
MSIRNLSIVIGILLSVVGMTQAAYIYDFKVIPDESSNPANAATGEEQLSLEVSSPAANQVLFSFSNTAFNPLPASITDIYYEDTLALLAGINHTIEGPGVDFGQGASPPKLPRGKNLVPAFTETPGLSFDSESPVQPNGVNPNEYLGLLFYLTSGMTLNDVINALNEGNMRIGIHVQGFADGGSETFINDKTPIVPEPTTLTLMSLGLGLLSFRSQTVKVKA